MSTNRTRTSTLTSPTYLKDTHLERTGLWVTTTTPISYRGEYTSIKDTNHPNFVERQKAGELIFGDVILTKTKRSYTDGSIEHLWYGNAEPPKYKLHTVSGDLAGYYVELRAQTAVVSASKSLNAQQRSLVQAYAKMNESALMIGESLADFGATVGMLQRPFRSATELASRMVKEVNLRKKKTSRSAKQAAADAWLEYRYGWRPLLMDTEKIISETHKNRQKSERSRLVARSGFTLQEKVSGSIPEQDGSTAGYYLYWTGAYSSEVTQRVSAGVMYSVLNGTSTMALDKFMGSRARDVVPTMWELLPYSFVVDWFVGVGDWLQAISPDPKIVVIDNWVTIVEETITRCNASSSRPMTASTMAGNLGGSERISRRYIRVCGNSLPNTPVRKLSAYKLNVVDGLALSLKNLQFLFGKLAH